MVYAANPLTISANVAVTLLSYEIQGLELSIKFAFICKIDAAGIQVQNTAKFINRPQMKKEISENFGGSLRVRVCGILVNEQGVLMVRHKGLSSEGYFWIPPGASCC